MPKPGDGTYLNTIERAGLAIRYLRVSAGPQRGKYVHQLVAEAMLGRPLLPHEEVDHLDSDTLNNAWTNLQVIDTVTHGRETVRRATAKREEARRARDRAAATVEDVPF